MIAYKLVRLKKDGAIGSLFIERKDNLPLNTWLEAEEHPTKGFAVRKGWHCTFKTNAPHLKKWLANGEERVWVKCEVEDYYTYDRPESQGGAWILANKMRILEVYKDIKCVKCGKRIAWYNEIINSYVCSSDYIDVLNMCRICLEEEE